MEIDKKLLDKQIKAVLESNMDEDIKNGLHNLLGTIYDRTGVFFEITSVCRDDIYQAFSDVDKMTPALKKRIKRLTDGEMRGIASKMSDSFCECCYWQSLISIMQRIMEG